MRHLVAFCAITAGMGCVASAAELGLASFYGHPRSGELTAAHRSLPFGSQVRVVNLDNGRAVVVKIVDRGPFIRGRIIDVSTTTAETLGFRTAGLAHVKIDVLAPSTPLNGPGRERRIVAAAPSGMSAYDICRYGADRAAHLRGASAGGVGGSRQPAECENLPTRLFVVAQRSEDLAPMIARGGVFLTEIEAAARIPVNAIAAVAKRDMRPSGGCRAQSDSASGDDAGAGAASGCKELRSQLLAFAERSKNFAPLAGHEKSLLTQTDAATRIPVTALAEVSPRVASAPRPARNAQPAQSNPIRSFFDQLRGLFE